MIQDKNSIRKQILSRRSALSPKELLEAEEHAANKLISMQEYQDSKTVMAYMDFRKEVPTGKLIKRILSDGKQLVLPLTDREFNIVPYIINPGGKAFDQLFTVSSFGIFEPNPALCPVADRSSIDLVIVPGSVFDHSGNRIGYGKGCYDRFLPQLRKDVFKLALAYEFQMLDQIPATDDDVKMDRILTV